MLDFGCDRGGFRRLLYALKPFRHALGVDIAHDSATVARELVGTASIDYELAADLSAWCDRFDIALSYEVIYLLPDIAAHAADIHAALRTGGVDYAVTGWHTESPLWPLWRGVIGESTNAPVTTPTPSRPLVRRVRSRHWL